MQPNIPAKRNKKIIDKNSLFIISIFFCGNLVLVSWQAFISSLVMKLDFISQPSSKSTLPFAGLKHMQQYHVNFHLIFASMLWSKWMVQEKWSPQWGLNPLDHGYSPISFFLYSHLILIRLSIPQSLFFHFVKTARLFYDQFCFKLKAKTFPFLKNSPWIIDKVCFSQVFRFKLFKNVSIHWKQICFYFLFILWGQMQKQIIVLNIWTTFLEYIQLAATTSSQTYDKKWYGTFHLSHF